MTLTAPPTPRRVSVLGYLRRTPSAGLLLVQLLGILLYPWMETSPRGRAVFSAFGLFILQGHARGWSCSFSVWPCSRASG